jgi:hypothetical protein
MDTVQGLGLGPAGGVEAVLCAGGSDYFESRFDLEGIIGSGAFSVVFKARSRADGRFYAIKRAKRFYGGIHDRYDDEHDGAFEALSTNHMSRPCDCQHH